MVIGALPQRSHGVAISFEREDVFDNFDRDLHFQRQMLKQLNDRQQANHLGESCKKNG